MAPRFFRKWPGRVWLEKGRRRRVDWKETNERRWSLRRTRGHALKLEKMS